MADSNHSFVTCTKTGNVKDLSYKFDGENRGNPGKTFSMKQGKTYKVIAGFGEFLLTHYPGMVKHSDGSDYQEPKPKPVAKAETGSQDPPKPKPKAKSKGKKKASKKAKK